MKFVLLACLATLAAAAPQDFQPIVQVLRDERHNDGSGIFNYVMETDNGIFMEASGTPGSLGQSNVQGSYRQISPEGILEEVRYVADEFGYQPQSPLLPTPHPLPAHAIEQIRFAEEQKAKGVIFE
ncbi:hypothetical protein Pmani_023852 [Petrolisthes manimaculis]|uniref:Uncharacterized protein n=1 Tax=Petrolisthes manimaculis TaxID=1843537 RepID=A0AAE1TZA3_9EUCA|nr:hypothetical protein Pmani_023852 [Petrolisthes manimaculis]